MTEYTTPTGSVQQLFSGRAHRKRATRFMDAIKVLFPDMSDLQCAYIAASSTDTRISLETKSMLACFAILAGPDLKVPVSEEELLASVEHSYNGALSLMLELAPSAGNA